MKTNGPWKIKNSIEKYKNPWIRVREDQVVRPDGKDGIFGVVEMVPGISVLPIDDKGYVYLTKEFHYGIERVSVEAASGAIEEGESDLAAAKRELKEELGIVADVWINLGKVDPFTTIINSSASLYLAKGLSFTETAPEGTEKIEKLKVRFTDALKMVMLSEITHGPTCVLILKTVEYLKRQKTRN